MKAAIARQIAGARDRAKHWGRLGARVRWGNYRNSTTKGAGGRERLTSEAGVAVTGSSPTLTGVNAAPETRGSTRPRRATDAAESTREAIAKLEAQFPHLRVQITEEEEETVC
jgi:hypothetical protein